MVRVAKIFGKKKIKKEKESTGDSNSLSTAKASEELIPCEIDGCGRFFAGLENVRNHMRRFHKDSVHACTWKECNGVFKHRSVMILFSQLLFDNSCKVFKPHET